MMLLFYRYMNRTGAHPSLRMDPDLRDFLTLDADLPKSSGTSALSAAGVMRLFGRMGDAVTKLSSHIAETDQVYIICLLLISRTSLYWVKIAIFSYGLVYISSICCSVQAWSFGHSFGLFPKGAKCLPDTQSCVLQSYCCDHHYYYTCITWHFSGLMTRFRK